MQKQYHQRTTLHTWEPWRTQEGDAEWSAPTIVRHIHGASVPLGTTVAQRYEVPQDWLWDACHMADLSILLGCKFWTRLLGSWKHVSRSWYVLIRKLWGIKVWFLCLRGSWNEWWYMCISCRILHNPIVFDTCYWWTHVPSVLCGCACRRVYVRGSLVIGLVWVPIQVLLCTRWYLSTS